MMGKWAEKKATNIKNKTVKKWSEKEQMKIENSKKVQQLSLICSLSFGGREREGARRRRGEWTRKMPDKNVVNSFYLKKCCQINEEEKIMITHQLFFCVNDNDGFISFLQI